MKIKSVALSIFFSLIIVTVSFASEIEKAGLLHQHGLTKEAKLELIEIIFSQASESSKAQAYYLLGSMAFEENKINVALDSWRYLTKKYPNSKQATLVKDRIGELAEIVGESAKESIENAVALSYLRHGDFWSKNKNEIFKIDSSWIPKVEAAIKWYDKVIAEFPNTAASRIAYQNKMRTLLGWEDPGRYGGKHGIEESFYSYMPLLLETFAAFEKEHPNASTLQAFRYQIAQAYWSNKNWEKTREWLNLIIKLSGENDTFYKDTAQRRLKKVEY
jgi:tetratricopeptide (TPR) repeat protein